MDELRPKEMSLLASFADAVVATPSSFTRMVDFVRTSANGDGLSPGFEGILAILARLWEKYGNNPSREDIVHEATELTGSEGLERLAGVALAWAAENSYRRKVVTDDAFSTVENIAVAKLAGWRARDKQASHAARGAITARTAIARGSNH